MGFYRGILRVTLLLGDLHTRLNDAAGCWGFCPCKLHVAEDVHVMLIQPDVLKALPRPQ